MNKMAIKLSDVANRAGVSKATASLALNNSQLVKTETKDLVLRVAKELNYIRDHNASNLVKKKSGVIGVVVPNIESEYYGRLIRNLDNAITQNGYSMLLTLSNEDPAQETHSVKCLIADRVEGIIIIPVNRSVSEVEQYVSLLDSQNIHCVFASSYYPNIKKKCIMADLESGSYNLTRYLLGMGHRNILFLCADLSIIPSTTRIHGIQRAFSEKGMEFPHSSIIVTPEINYAGAYSYISNHLRELDQTDAIITVNDMMALGVINALMHHGIAVPEKIAVAGYDNVTYSTVSPIPITTINQNLQQIARDSVDILLYEIKNGSTAGENFLKLIETDLVIRKST